MYYYLYIVPVKLNPILCYIFSSLSEVQKHCKTFYSPQLKTNVNEKIEKYKQT